jgi:hypothetical protein
VRVRDIFCFFEGGRVGDVWWKETSAANGSKED